MMVQPAPESPRNEPSVQIDRFDWLIIVSLIAVWVLIEVIINPIGDFPLNDDWIYGLVVKWLAEQGRLMFIAQAAALLTQVIWGSLFVLSAGFSFTVLRFSTLVIAAFGLTATYLVGREAGLNRRFAAIFVGLFLINPLLVSLANSFMTDVPFISLMMLAVLFLLRGTNRNRSADLWIGWAFVLAATLLRQVGFAVAVGLVVAMAMKDGMNRKWLIRAVVPSAVVLAVILAYPRVLNATVGMPHHYSMFTDNLKAVLGDLAHLRLGALRPIVRGVGWGLLHMGLWMLPLLLLIPPNWNGEKNRRNLLLTLATLCSIAAVVTGLLWFANASAPSTKTKLLMPIGVPGNILVDFGTGHRDLSGQGPHAPVWFWVAITWAAAFGAASIILVWGQITLRAMTLIRSGQSWRSFWLAAFLLVSLVVCYAPFCVQYGPWVDRYVLPPMVLLTLLFMRETFGVIPGAQRISTIRALLSTSLVLLYLGFAVAATHDYLAWNRERLGGRVDFHGGKSDSSGRNRGWLRVRRISQVA